LANWSNNQNLIFASALSQIMRILIIEDEQPAAKRLQQLIASCEPQAEIIACLDSVGAAVAWLSAHPSPDLIFMDIQLADNLSFEIFNQVEVSSPVIFTTAFDQYTLKAFKVNSVDYLLKPIELEELAAAMRKYEQLYAKPQHYDLNAIRQMMQAMSQPSYKERFIVKTGQQLTYINTGDIAYFFSEDGVVQAMTWAGKKYLIEYTLEQLEPLLPPADFFRINRKMILDIKAVKKIAPYFNSRLILQVSPAYEQEILVSRERVNDFKKWLDK